MDLKRVRVSDTVTRYLVNADLGPRSDLLLVRPEDRLIITGWSSRSEPVRIAGEWVSPYSNLIAVVRGEDRGAATSSDELGSAIDVAAPALDASPLVA